MKLNFLVFFCLTLFTFNCSNSDDSNSQPGRPEGEIVLYFDTLNPNNTTQFSSTSNAFEVPCDFAELDIFSPVNTDNRTFEFLDINIPIDAIFTGDNFSIGDTFSDGLGNDLTTSVSIRVDGDNYVAVAGDFRNLEYVQSETQAGTLLISFEAELAMEFTGTSGRNANGNNLNIRIVVREVGKGTVTTC